MDQTLYVALTGVTLGYVQKGQVTDKNKKWCTEAKPLPHYVKAKEKKNVLIEIDKRTNDGRYER